jgi:hypothetical protein
MRALFLMLGALAMLCPSVCSAFEAQAKKSRLYLPEVKIEKVVTGDGIYTYPPYARGKKGRKYVRRFSLRENLTGDKLKALETFGYTPHRLRFRDLGKVTERWLYYSLGLELVFDENDNLISQRRFPPESGHID